MPDVALISLRFGRLRGSMPPIGPLSLVATLKRAGISCSLTDTQLDPEMNQFAIEELTGWILGTEAPVLAFSVFNDSIPLLVATLNSIGPKLSDRRIFVGGPGVVGIAERLMETVPCIGCVIVGEGETAFPRAIIDPKTASALPGVFTRDASGTIIGSGRTAREDLDKLPLIDWSQCAGKSYSVVPWSTMRGCPFACQFCEIIAFMGRTVKVSAIPRAIEDLERAIDALGYRSVAILDDTFTLNKRRVLELCDELSRRNLNISFEVFSRADTLDTEMMTALAEAGCCRVFFGIDGGDDEVLKRVSKGLTIECAERTMMEAAHFFDVTASFIWGYPFESLEAFERMLLLAKRLKKHEGSFPIWPQLHLLSPSAGTPLFDQFKETLSLESDAETLPLGSRLSTQSFRPSFSKILAVIADDVLLSAPFYRYGTPMFKTKSCAVDEFNRSLDQEIGNRIIHELERMELYA
jgi:anaerobic magnesium-protoporphyrin IX monomethyl ester cyclase